MRSAADSLEVLMHRLAEAFNALDIFRIPVELALHSVVAAVDTRLFQAQRLSNDFDQVDHIAWLLKLGLARLIPEIQRRCPSASGNTFHATPPDHLATVAAEAIEFALRYEWAQHYIFLARHGYFHVQQEGRDYIFEYVHPEDARYIWFEGKLHDTEKRSRFANKSLQVAYRRIDRKLALLKPVVSVGTKRGAINKLSGQTYSDVLEIESSVCVPSDLPDDLSVGRYSLAEARAMWISMRALASSISIAASALLDHYDSGTLEDFSPFQFEKAGLADLIVRSAGVAHEKADHFISEITLHPVRGRPDLQMTPLIPLPNGSVTFSPVVLGSVEWETCTLRRLSVTDGGAFSGTIGAKKKALAGLLADMLRQKGFLVNRTVTIFDVQGNPRGDIDVAVYDRPTNHLSLVEMKWFIPSDSAHEMVSNDRKVEEERQKFRNFLRYVLNNVERCWTCLFPSFMPDFASMKISTYMVCRGSVGRAPLEGSIPVFDYDSTVREIENSNGTLEKLWDDVLRQHEGYVEPDPPVGTLRLAGQWLRLPARIIDLEDERSAYDLSKGPRRCSCGSGRRFSDCCFLDRVW